MYVCLQNEYFFAHMHFNFYKLYYVIYLMIYNLNTYPPLSQLWRQIAFSNPIHK